MQALDIREVIRPDLIVTDIEANTKEAVIQVLIKQLYFKGFLNDEDEFFQNVMEREAEGVTGLGNGIAIPHGKSEAVRTTMIAIGKTKQPIVWESLDDDPVQVIILFAVKKTDETTIHIKLLQKVAVLLADEELLENLVEAEDREVIYKILTTN